MFITSTSSLLLFLVGTFSLSLLAFGLMLAIPAAQSPEGWPGLPIWLVAVWSPSLMAIFCACRTKSLDELLSKVWSIRGLGLVWWVLLLSCGVFCVAVFWFREQADWKSCTPSLFLFLVGFNLFLGPLGEELGWRGLLQPALQMRFGWWGATCFVAVIWALWHAPLWYIDSPQREIPFVVFCVHVFAYSVTMASASSLAPHSLLPAILLHLVFNVSSGLVVLLGLLGTSKWYTWSAPGYVVVAVYAYYLTFVRG